MKIASRIGEMIEGALGNLPGHMGAKPIHRGQITGEEGGKYSGKYEVLPEEYLETDFESASFPDPADVKLKVPKSDFDDYDELFDTLRLIQNKTPEEITSGDIIDTLEELRDFEVITDNMSADDIFEIGQDMMDSTDGLVIDIGKFLNAPRTQMVIEEMTRK